MTKKTIKILIIAVFLLSAYFILFKIVKIQDKILKEIYPTRYSEYVEPYAKENNVDPYMIYAIIKAESNFNPNVTSESNAIGLMQLLEETAEEISNVVENKEMQTEDLYSPEVNIRLGISYYAYLLKHYKGNNVLALAAYNAGMGNVDTWVQTGTIKEDGSDIENIPYQETNNYVRKILRDYQYYLKLYDVMS